MGATDEHGSKPTEEISEGARPASVLQQLAAATGITPRVELPAEEESSPPPGGAGEERCGPYVVIREIARGGMGRVLYARDPDLRRSVAVKVIHDELASRPDVICRFVEEAQICGQLQHPGIVAVHALGLQDGGLLPARDARNRVVRGGTWNAPSPIARSSYRTDYIPTLRAYNLGVRPARALERA